MKSSRSLLPCAALNPTTSYLSKAAKTASVAFSGFGSAPVGFGRGTSLSAVAAWFWPNAFEDTAACKTTSASRIARG